MCHSRAKNDEINRLQEKDAYGLFRTTKYLLLNSCWKMLVMFLIVEIIKVAKGLKCYLFPLKDQNNLEDKSFIKIPRNKTVRDGLESISYLGPNIWEILLQEIQEYEPLLESHKLSL